VRELRREASPHVAGLFSSVVMLPPSAASWTSEARQAALVHELTHIKRGDRRTQAIAQLACAVYWFNPLVWYAAAGLSRERERACDDEVLRFGAKPSAYATLLLDLARTPASMWTPATALSMARPSAIEGRLLSILADAVRVPRRSTRWIVGFGLVTITTTILGAQAAKPGETPQEGVIVVRQFGRGDVYVSGAATTETAAFANTTAGLSDAMKTLTVARFGRHEKFDSMADEAVQTAIRVTKDQQSAHSLLKEWSSSFSASVVDLRKKVWS